MLLPVIKGTTSPQVVSAPSSGAPPARLRIAMSPRACTRLEGFPEFIPSTSRVSARRHLFDESPALTAVLQAQHANSNSHGRSKCLRRTDSAKPDILPPPCGRPSADPQLSFAVATVGCAGLVGSRLWQPLPRAATASSAMQVESIFIRTSPLRTCTATLAWRSPEDLRTQAHEALLHERRLLARLLYLIE
jgi:hypothetical protein